MINFISRYIDYVINLADTDKFTDIVLKRPYKQKKGNCLKVYFETAPFK